MHFPEILNRGRGLDELHWPMKSIKLVSSKNFEEFFENVFTLFSSGKFHIAIYCHLHNKRQCEYTYQRYDKIEFWMEEARKKVKRVLENLDFRNLPP